MFWGLIIEPNKRYTQTVEKSFHVSMACLDRTSADGEDVQVVVCYNGCSFLACTLNKGTVSQTPLDLYFEEGSKISFMSNGQGLVHLTGYVLPEDELDPDECEEDEEDEEEEEEEEEEVPQLVRSKRKATAKESNKAKRLKIAQKEAESSDDDENLIDPTALLSGDEDDDDEIDSEDAEEDEDEEEDGEDDEEEEQEESDEKQVEIPVKQQKKTKKKEQKQQQQQQQQQQLQQQNKKAEKQKLVNGKDVKQEQESKQQKQKKKNKGEQNQQQQQQNNEQTVQKKRIIEGGVQVEDIKVGEGPIAKSGKVVSVYYVGRLKNGKKFDSTTQGAGFKFRLGKGEVIKGWDIGIAGLKVGGKRRITIPPAMAYGAKGSPPTIPSNSTLIFEVELKNVH